MGIKNKLIKNINVAKNIAILGGGAWGMALAMVISRENCNKYYVHIYTKRDEIINNINENRHHPTFPQILINENISAKKLLKSNLEDYDAVLFAVRTSEFRKIIRNVKVSNKSLIVICNKGIELLNNKSYFMSQILQNEINIKEDNISVLSGPNFASEVITNLYTVSTLACISKNNYNILYEIFNDRYFRIERSSDIIGVQFCGALKNVFAIGAGMILGLNMGHNAHAALINKGFCEMREMLGILKCNIDTALTSAGIGDLILTCSDQESRNMRFGYNLARLYNNPIATFGTDSERNLEAQDQSALEISGYQEQSVSEIEFRKRPNKTRKSIGDIIADLTHNNTVEGINTLAALSNIFSGYHAKLPLLFALKKVLYDDSVDSIKDVLIEVL